MPELGRRSFLGILGAAGALGAGAALAAPAGAVGQHCRGGCVVFVGSYTGPDGPVGHGLDVARRNGAALSLDHTVAGVPNASWFARSADGRVLYSTNENSPDGMITALDVRDPAAPKILNSKSSKGSAPTHLSVHPSGRYLLAANYADGTVVVLPIEQGGRLGEATDLVRHTGPERDAHAHQVVTDPSGRWVLAVDLGADSVYVYTLDLKTGKLALHKQVSLPSGAGPRHLVFHPGGKVAYIAQELRPEITVATWDSGSGTLTPVRVVPAIEPGTTGEQYPGEIAVTRDGRFVHLSVRGENTLVSFAVSDGGRSLRTIGRVVTGGNWPRHFTLDPEERWFYVSNQRSGTVTWLPRDPATGLPGAARGSLAVPSVATVLFS